MKWTSESSQSRLFETFSSRRPNLMKSTSVTRTYEVGVRIFSIAIEKALNLTNPHSKQWTSWRRYPRYDRYGRPEEVYSAGNAHLWDPVLELSASVNRAIILVPEPDVWQPGKNLNPICLEPLDQENIMAPGVALRRRNMDQCGQNNGHACELAQADSTGEPDLEDLEFFTVENFSTWQFILVD